METKKRGDQSPLPKIWAKSYIANASRVEALQIWEGGDVMSND